MPQAIFFVKTTNKYLNSKILTGYYVCESRADPEQCCCGCQNCWGVRARQREALAEGAAAGVWGRKNRSPRVLECT